MPLPAVHFLSRADEARTAAKLSADPELRNLFLEIARAYTDLADNEERLVSRRSAGVRMPEDSPYPAEARDCQATRHTPTKR